MRLVLNISARLVLIIFTLFQLCRAQTLPANPSATKVLSSSSASAEFTLPNNYVGTCTVYGTIAGLSTNLTSVNIQIDSYSPNVKFFDPRMPTGPITIQYPLSFISISSNPSPGKAFSFNTRTDAPSLTYYIQVNLVCGSSTLQTWNSVRVSKLYSTTLNANIPSGSSCYLYAPSSTNFYSAQSSSFTVQSYIITITSPTSGSKWAAGSNLTVSWNTSSSSVGTPFTVSISCASCPWTYFNTLTGSTVTTNIPDTAYGSCTTTVSTTGFTSGTVNFNVTQQLSFKTPIDGDAITLTSLSLPVKLATSGGNLYDSTGTNLTCGGSSGIYNIPANTNSSISMSSPNAVTCTLAIISASTYLVLPSPSSITFSVTISKYNLTFNTLPSTVYRGQNFTIQIDTTTAADSPPPVILNLICLKKLVSATWNDVLINQPNNLTLPTTVPLDSCFFQVNSNDFYNQANSSSVQVTKVPITIDLPNSLIQYSIPSDVPLLISTTVSPVSGTVNLRLNCTSMTTPYPVSIPINTLGTFSYPADAYGACRIAIAKNDPIFW